MFRILCIDLALKNENSLVLCKLSYVKKFRDNFVSNQGAMSDYSRPYMSELQRRVGAKEAGIIISYYVYKALAVANKN